MNPQSTDASPNNHIDTEIDDISKFISRLQEQIELMELRLAPVLLPELPLRTQEDPNGLSTSPLGHQLYHEASKLSRLSESVERMLSRIDL